MGPSLGHCRKDGSAQHECRGEATICLARLLRNRQGLHSVDALSPASARTQDETTGTVIEQPELHAVGELYPVEEGGRRLWLFTRHKHLLIKAQGSR